MELTDLKKKVLLNIDPDKSSKFIERLNSYLDDSDDKEIRRSFFSIYNELYKTIFLRFLNIEDEFNRFFIRYSTLEDFITGDNIEKVESLDDEVKDTISGMEYPILYPDEWIEMVESEEIPLTAGDDLTKMSKKQSPAEKLQEFLQKHGTEKKNLEKMVVLRQSYITGIHNEWKNILISIITKDELDAVSFADKVKNDKQIGKIMELMPKLSAINSRITTLLNQMGMAANTIQNLKANVSPEEMKKIQNAESEKIKEEYKSVKQLYKMCVGRQGNDIPFLCDQYYPPVMLDRAKVRELIEKIREIDPTIFERTFLGIDSNNPPYTLICPVVGKNGVCWEPIPKTNKETGRGKIAVPMYPAIDEELIITRAMADYRWQKEKEIAGFRWMNEGLTGHYYMYHEGLKADKRKGKKVIPFNNDLKESFIENYILWIKFESQGVQKLDKEVRKIFWFNIPFPDKIKDVLKDRGFHYKQLCENDARKAKSTGY